MLEQQKYIKYVVDLTVHGATFFLAKDGDRNIQRVCFSKESGDLGGCLPGGLVYKKNKPLKKEGKIRTRLLKNEFLIVESFFSFYFFKFSPIRAGKLSNSGASGK